MPPPVDMVELAMAAFPPRYRHRWIVMLQGFVDVSEDAASRVMTCAGFIGSVSGWCKVQDRMQRIRDFLGVEFLHMTELMAKDRRPPYDRLSPEERTELMIQI